MTVPLSVAPHLGRRVVAVGQAGASCGVRHQPLQSLVHVAKRAEIDRQPLGVRRQHPGHAVGGQRSGDDCPPLGWMAAANLAAESAIRWNPLRGPRATLEAELPAHHRGAFPDEAYVLDAPFALEDSSAWARGRAMGQSRASMLPAHAVAPRANEHVIDMCAAPGAKATHLAALARNACRLVAVELHASRAAGLRRLAHRMGAVMEVVEGDARTVPLRGDADAVLLDPPCTGLGVLAARPDARWRRREEAIAPLVALQRALVERAMELLRPGGRLVYSTCTLLPEENERLLASLGLQLDPALCEEWPSLAHPRVPGALLVLPHRHGTDGFFVARVIA